MKRRLAILATLMIIFLGGCLQSPAAEKDLILSNYNDSQNISGNQPADPVTLCISQCNSLRINETNIENGPCLLDPIPEDPSWVCDVAHSPREAIDNLPENQCQSYRNGTSSHFIEVTPDCIYLRKV